MKESEIRPKDVFAEYIRLSALDGEKYFSDNDRVPIPCPACDSSDLYFAFEKQGFEYQSCQTCGSLFQSPRPPLGDFVRFYTEGASSEYWATTFFPAVLNARRSKIIAPRVAMITAFCKARGFIPRTVADAGAGYGVFLEEWEKVNPGCHRIAIEPNPTMAEACRQKGLEVSQTIIEDAANRDCCGDLVTCFEVIEHTHDPPSFVEGIARLVRPGGWALVTGLGVDGFDVQVLWNSSDSISPPHHINFLSVRGFERLFARVGFSDILIETPGQLDVDIVMNAVSGGFAFAEEQRFLQLLLSRGEAVRSEFQQFLFKSQLSSHCWIWARKPVG